MILINAIGLLWGVLFTASFFVKYETPRFIVAIAARGPRRFIPLLSSFLRVFLHVFCLLFLLWFVLLVATFFLVHQ